MIRNRIIKYILMGLLTIIAIRYVPKHRLNDDDIIIIGILVSIGYAILDKLLPSYYLE